MTTRVQLSLFDNPEGPDDDPQGIFMPNQPIESIPPRPETNATKKRNKRRSWYLQTQLKRPKGDGKTVA